MKTIKSSPFFYVIVASILFLAACKEEKENPYVDLNSTSRQVFILSEGNFQSANGSISVYDPISSSLNHNLFKANNNGRPLGDVVQSMVKMDKNYFIVVNNSAKIEVVSAINFSSVGKITGLNSPRYILPINSSKAYVSDLFSDELYVINPQTLSIEKTIPTKGWTEEMVLVDGKAFVCQVDSSQILVFDVKTDSILTKIPTNLQPQSIVVDNLGKVWVACSGGINQGKPALHRINPINFMVEQTFEEADVTKSIGSLSINENGDKLLYLMNDIFEMDIQSNALPLKSKISSNGRLIYGFGVDVITGEIYLSDAIDYLQQGVIYRYNSSGEELGNFKAGIIPGSFYFD